jgi:hypothetical protein
MLIEMTPIPNYENYFATKNGDIFSNKRGKLIKLTPRKNKKARYFSVILYSNGLKKGMFIHRLIAFTFLEKPHNEKTEVNHKNLNKLDNSVDNLEWISHSDNVKHHDLLNGRRVRGSKTRMAKLTVYQVIEILELKDKHSQRELARMFGVKQAAIWSIIHRKSWNDFSIKLELERDNGQ